MMLKIKILELFRGKKNSTRWFLMFSLVIIFSGCEGILRLDLTGDGNIITKKVVIGSVSEVELNEPFFLEIYQSATNELYLEADSNLMSYIETLEIGEKLTIGRRSNYSLSPRKPIKIRLYTNDINSITVSEGGVVLCDTLIVDNLDINVYGTSRISCGCITVDVLDYYAEGGTLANINGCTNSVNIQQIGSAEAVLSGETKKLSVIQEGSGKVESYNLNASNVDVRLFGSGLIFCKAINNLNVTIDGKGRVYYIGNPGLTTQISGGGLLVKDDF